MVSLFHRFILYVSGTILLFSGVFSAGHYFLAICMLIYICALYLISDIHLKWLLKIIYIVLCFRLPVLAFYIPSFLYEQTSKYRYLNFLFIIPLIILTSQTSVTMISVLAILSLVSYFLGEKTETVKQLKMDILTKEDVSNELAILNEKRNQELRERQEIEIHMATLNERNRISRDIHDNLGHLLTRSILQVGALAATTKENELHAELTGIQQTLNEGMTSVRNSIHGLYADSIDLDQEVKKLTDFFQFPSFQYHYVIHSEMPTKIKLAFLTIIKEAFNNIQKHSNATLVKLSIKENKQYYVMIIHDNGTTISPVTTTGIGIRSIEERVRLLDGTFNIQTENGYRIYISLPKE